MELCTIFTNFCDVIIRPNDAFNYEIHLWCQIFHYMVYSSCNIEEITKNKRFIPHDSLIFNSVFDDHMLRNNMPAVSCWVSKRVLVLKLAFPHSPVVSPCSPGVSTGLLDAGINNAQETTHVWACFYCNKQRYNRNFQKYDEIEIRSRYDRKAKNTKKTY